MACISWLRLIDWEKLPQTTRRKWFGRTPVPRAAYIGSYLVKLEQGLNSTGKLRRYLTAHPALVWALGFPLVANLNISHGFSADDSLPSRRHFNTALSQLPMLQKHDLGFVRVMVLLMRPLTHSTFTTIFTTLTMMALPLFLLINPMEKCVSLMRMGFPCVMLDCPCPYVKHTQIAQKQSSPIAVHFMLVRCFTQCQRAILALLPINNERKGAVQRKCP